MTENLNDYEDLNVLKHRKLDLQRRLDRTKITPLGIALSTTCGIILTVAGLLTSSTNYGGEGNTLARVIAISIIGGFLGLSVYLYFFIMLSSFVRPKLREVEYRLARFGADELQESIEEDFFNKLIKINFKYIDQYYLQTQEQANKSFKLSSWASLGGLAIIAIGIFMMFMGKTEPAYVTAGAGVLGEFIAAVFFYLYNKTILKMSDYHQKLVITQNISLALKISDDLPDEEKIKSKVFLIEKLTENVNNLLANGT